MNLLQYGLFILLISIFRNKTDIFNLFDLEENLFTKN
jgi:hypothetical protein